MKDMCADCGTDLSRDDIAATNIASIPMVHSVPELKVLLFFLALYYIDSVLLTVLFCLGERGIGTGTR